MFAVLKTGGKQYRVSPNDVIVIEKIGAKTGDLVQFGEILMVGGPKTEIGTPVLASAAVNAVVVEQAKSKKVVSFVKRRRKHSSQRKRGHRQQVTVLRVRDIFATGVKSEGQQIHDGIKLIGSDPA